MNNINSQSNLDWSRLAGVSECPENYYYLDWSRLVGMSECLENYYYLDWSHLAGVSECPENVSEGENSACYLCS